MTTAQHDPRPLFRSALEWAGDLFAGVRPEQMTDPTPCPEFDVRTLLGHLASTVDRGRVIGMGGDVHSVPEVLSSPDDAWPGTLDAVTTRYWEVWDDDALLDRPVTAPWGTFPGRAAVLVSLNEVLVHGWDLAVSTGQDPEADPALARAAHEIMERALPASPRGGEVPFGPVVDSTPDAGPTERLANWCGRVTAPWMRPGDA
jgi:uncharacterized protein (TIGR03086 family)